MANMKELIEKLAASGVSVEVAKGVVTRTKCERSFPLEGHIARLQDDAKRFDERHDFQPGDLLQWKYGMDIHACGPEPFIFRRWEAPPERMQSRRESASFYGTDNEDCVIGALLDVEQGVRFVEWFSTSARLEPFKG